MSQVKRQTNCYIDPSETIRPLRDQIFLRPLDWDASKIIIAIRHGNAVRGEVVAVGPGRYQWKRKKGGKDKPDVVYETDVFVPTEVKVGDIIELGGLNIFDGQGYAFDEVTYGNEVLLICSERDVCGVRE